MLNRRKFLSSGAAVAGVAACGPAFAFGRHTRMTSSAYVRSTLRWLGGTLYPVFRSGERIADYLVFTTVEAGGVQGTVDLFVRAPAPAGHTQPTILSPLGRHRDPKSAHRTIRRHLQSLHTALRLNRPGQEYIQGGEAHVWPYQCDQRGS